MTVCEICDGESFESIDGYYYCVACGTRVENMQEMDREYNELNFTLHNLKEKKEVKRYERVSGRPWYVHEAFQIIIQKQLEFLIKLGVDPKLKDIVGQIWFKYLKKCGIAFCDNKNVFPTIGYLKKGAIYNHNAKIRTPQKNLKKKNPKVEDDDALFELSSEIFNTESDESEADSSMDDDWEECIGCSTLSSITFKRRLTMCTTLSFSYLGLLYMNVPIFISDILRWVKEGHFPYFNATTLLPDYMKFRDSDSRIFTTEMIPKRSEVLVNNCNIIHLVKLKLPEQDLRKYTSRFIIDLHFPAITHGIVNNLIKQPGTDTTVKFLSETTKFEEMAMALIVIALKMFYGFDDSQHQAEADLARHLKPSKSRDSLPTWRDWVSATRECQAKKQASGVPWTSEELRNIRDPWMYTSFCKSRIFGSWTFRDLEMLTGRSSLLGFKRKGNRKEYRENCSEIFSNLTEGANTTEQPAPTPTSFPNTCRHGNSSANEDEDASCFKDCHARRIPLQDFRRLCSSTERGKKNRDISYRKYNLYLSKDYDGDTHHPSFRFLLDLLAKHIFAKPDYLNEIITRLEENFFAVPTPVTGRWTPNKSKDPLNTD